MFAVLLSIGCTSQEIVHETVTIEEPCDDASIEAAQAAYMTAVRRRLASLQRQPQSERDPASTDQRVIHTLYILAANGDQEALRTAYDKLESDALSLSSEAHADAYLGSIALLRASASTNLADKFRLSKQGLTLLDGAVTAAPDDPLPRCLRGVTCFNLPGIFGRRAQAAADLERFAATARQSVESGQVPADLAGVALLYYGQTLVDADQPQEAARAWASASQLSPDTPAGLRARCQRQSIPPPIGDAE